MPSSDTVKKPSNARRTIRKFPPAADYCDDISDEQLKYIRELAEPKDLKETEVVSGPGW